MKRLSLLLVLLLAVASYAFSQRADLSGIKICIDPGHAGRGNTVTLPDLGSVFSEGESNFAKALHLKSMLEARGATVILTHATNDYPDGAGPTLEARVAFANSNNVTWFHSIHSNALGSANPSTNYTLVLVREKRAGGPFDGSGTGLGVPEDQRSWDISTIIGPNIRANMRTKSFYGVALDLPFEGFSLGVLRGLSMPGELSEGEFHDYYPETRLLMNNDCRKMEAYAIRDAFLQYFGVPADTMGIVAGIVSEPGTGKMVDAVQVRLLPENVVYTGDLYHNGFYMFDGIRPGTHWVRFETPGYRRDSAQVNIGVGQTKFVDWQTETTAAPAIIVSTPANNDTSFSAAGQIQFTFSKIMDTASIRSAFSIAPSVKGSLIWSSSNTVLTFKPDSVVLPFNTNFTIRIEATGRSQSGLSLDGNGDGTPGDAYVLKFRTKPVDVWPPVMIASSPASTSSTVASNSVINFTFDEPLDPTSVNSTNIVVQEVGTGNRQLSFLYDTRNGHGGVNIFPQTGLTPGKSYKVRLSGVKDIPGNPLPATYPLYNFSVAPLSFQYTIIEDFGATMSSWATPQYSGNTTGIDSATFTKDSLVTLSVLPSTSRSARLTYTWNTTTATDWLIREYLVGGAPRSITWNKRGARLQTYVYGDGSGTLFRFAVDDSVDVFPGGTTQNHEVSLWTPINWVGWRLVEWDLENDSIGTWLGNGKLEGLLRFDSFQLKYVQGSKITSGAIYVAQLQIARNIATAVEPVPGSVPYTFDLQQNYPNPFNPSTTIAYTVDRDELVQLNVVDILGRLVRTIVAGRQAPGHYQARWDGRNDRGETVSSGVYLYQLKVGSSLMTKKMLLLK